LGPPRRGRTATAAILRAVATPLDLAPRQITALQDVATRLLDGRRPGTELRKLARDLLAGFHEQCLRAGNDGLLVALDPEVTVDDWSSLADHPRLALALTAALEAIDLDGGGPRSARPGQLADCVVAALGLTVVEPSEPPATLTGEVRAAALAAMASVLDPALGPPQIRDAIIAEARARCDAAHHDAFDRLAEHLDERGLQLLKQPKIALGAVQAVQRALTEARLALIASKGGEAIDRAAPLLAAADAAAAARLDQPITLRLTPRDVALRRAADPQLLRTPPAIAQTLLDGLADGARIAWLAPVEVVRRYAASATFAVGDVIEHVKFGRGTVQSIFEARIQVEFADGVKTLVHAPARA
jgi:hypothetical protein